jgi:hypothetical protein
MKLLCLLTLLVALFALAYSYDDCSGQVNTQPLID